ncbi:MAG TPA: hypothetical protein VFI22_00725, partial [Thermomicrobiales bacterium]|nr:hypothetical protein [Thermomicrobiales bacterium]
MNTFATAAGLTLSADTQIKFQHYDPDSFTAPDGGFAFDDIHVSAPVSSPLTLSGPVFYLRLDNTNPSAPVLDVWNNATASGSPSQTALLSTISSLTVTGTAAADTLIIDFANGDPLPPSGVSFTGGSGANSLGLVDDSSGDTVVLNATTATLTSPVFGSTVISYSAGGGGTTAVTVTGGSGNDTLTQSAALAAQPTFAGGAGNDVLNVNAGAYAFNSDASATTGSLTVNVAAGASTTFNAVQHLAALNIDGGAASLTATGGKVLVTKSLSIINGGRLDLNDNDMIVDYTGASPIGTWNGSAYSGILGLIQTGRNNAAWNGPGIDSTNAAGTGGLTSLGVDEAASQFQITAGQTALFDSQTVDDTAVIIKYTYAGDANLDGRLNGDDYFAIDSHV